MERAGYTLTIRKPGWHEHRMFKGPEIDLNLHVFSSGCPEAARMLAFRDRLRANPADRERYERTKRELAARPWQFVQNYADAKSEVVESILADAARGA
ncbi:MAG: GrpB family protein [Myxococcaceae bacterium]